MSALLRVVISTPDTTNAALSDPTPKRMNRLRPLAGVPSDDGLSLPRGVISANPSSLLLLVLPFFSPTRGKSSRKCFPLALRNAKFNNHVTMVDAFPTYAISAICTLRSAVPGLLKLTLTPRTLVIPKLSILNRNPLRLTKLACRRHSRRQSTVPRRVIIHRSSAAIVRRPSFRASHRRKGNRATVSRRRSRAMTHRESYKPGQHRSKHPVKRQRDRRRTDDEQRDDDANVIQLRRRYDGVPHRGPSARARGVSGTRVARWGTTVGKASG